MGYIPSFFYLFLIYTAIIPRDEHRFVDLVTSEVLTDQFYTEYSLLRVIFEPISFVIFNILDKDLVWVPPFLLGLIFYLMIKEKKQLPHFTGTIGVSICCAVSLGGLIVLVSIFAGYREYVEKYILRASYTLLLVGLLNGLIIHAYNRKYKKNMLVSRQLWFNILGLVFFSMLINYLTLAIAWPSSSIGTKKDGIKLADFHSHTMISDATLPVSQRIQYYKQYGISIIAISDHDTIEGSIEAKKILDQDSSFTVLTAQEYTGRNPVIHFNIFNYNSSIRASDGEEQIIADLKRIRKAGGIVVLNHYFDRFKSIEFTRVIDYIDGIEIYNGMLWKLSNEHTKDLLQLAKQSKKMIFVGSDSHQNDEINVFTAFDFGDDKVTEEFIFKKIRQNEHKLVKIEKNSLLDLPHQYAVFLTFERIANYFYGMSRVQALSLLIWSLFFHGFYLTRRVKGKRIMNTRITSE